MKFLVLALFVSAATAAVQPFKSWQPVNTAKAYAEIKPAPARKYVAEPVPTYNKNVQVVGGQNVDATVLRQESAVSPDGFNYAYETSNGISAAATGSLKNVDNVDVLTVQGQYQYPLEDGTPFQLSYVADEYGYQPKSDFLPVAPPVPEAILRSLEYIAAHADKRA